MNSNNTKRGSRLTGTLVIVVVATIICVMATSPFVIVKGDSGGVLELAEANAFNFKDTLNSTAETVGLRNPSDPPQLSYILGRIIYSTLALIGSTLLIIIVVGGFRILMAGGNEESITKGKQLIRNAFVGTLIVMGAYALTYFIIKALT
jgi:hypothetical protein